MKSKYTGRSKSAECANSLLNEIDEDNSLRRMPFKDQASFLINDVLIVIAAECGEQNSHKKVASTCVTPSVWCGYLYL